jgi:hypothetical protein
MKLFAVGIFGAFLSGCVIGGNSARPAPAPTQIEAAYRVTVGKSDPPPGAVELGSIEAVHGEGCGSWGQRGTFDGAMFQLRNLAATRQANYVMLISAVEPHLDAGCYNNEFKIRGLAYRIPDGGAAQSPPMPPPAASPPAALQPSSAPAGSSACYPPCSPGYRCEAQTCIALCNPACGAGQVCRQDRTCAPDPTKAPAPASASTTLPVPVPATSSPR